MLTRVVSENDIMEDCCHCDGELQLGQKYVKLETKLPLPNCEPNDDVSNWQDVTLECHYTCFTMLSVGVMKNIGKFGFDAQSAALQTGQFFKGFLGL